MAHVRAHVPIAIHAIVALGLCAGLLAVTEKSAAQKQESARPAISKQSKGSISGHVYRSDTGEPVGKAVVSLDPQDENTSKAAGGSRVARTGPDGAFTFDELPAGAYAMSAWRNGFATSRTMWEPNSSRLSLKPGQTLENMIVQLIPAGIITGSVYDEDQEPVASVSVEVLRINFLPGGRREIYFTNGARTDDLGNFRFAGLLPGSYYVRAGGTIHESKFALPLKEGPEGGMQYSDTYFPGTALLDEAQFVEVKSGLATENIRIPVATERTYSITGAVLGVGKDEKLKPSELRIQKRSNAIQMWGIGGGALNPDGSFAIRRLPPGEYTLTAVAIEIKRNEAGEVDRGFASVRITDGNVHADVQIGRAGEVRGKVDVPQGFSFAGKQIILESIGSVYYGTNLESSGEFDLRNVPPGEYTISLLDRKSQVQGPYIKLAVCSGRDEAFQPLELTLDAMLDCRITVADDTATVGGHVTNVNRAAAGLIVVLVPQARTLRRMPRYTLTANIDTAGNYKLAGVIPGDYYLFAVPRDNAHVYYALDFTDRNQSNAVRIRVGARGNQVADLKPAIAQ